MPKSALMFAIILLGLTGAPSGAETVSQAVLEAQEYLRIERFGTPKEVNVGCFAGGQIPSTPTEAIVASEEFRDGGLFGPDIRYRIDVWRARCPDGDQQLVLTFVPLSGGSMSIPGIFNVRHEGETIGWNASLWSNMSGAPLGSFSSPKSAVLRSIGGNANSWDDERALSIFHAPLGGSSKRFGVPAAGSGSAPSDFVVDERVRGTYLFADAGVPVLDGHGVLLDVEPTASILIGSIYTGAREAGAEAIEWFTFAGDYGGDSATLTVFRTRGIGFMSGTGETSAAGSGTIQFDSCGSATLDVTLDSGHRIQSELLRFTSVPSGC